MKPLSTTDSLGRRSLARRQTQALQAIVRHIRAYQEAPTRTELGRLLGISAVSAHLLVHKLAEAGHLRLHAGRRGIEVVAIWCEPPNGELTGARVE